MTMQTLHLFPVRDHPYIVGDQAVVHLDPEHVFLYDMAE
jgi:hypothetical protein